MLLELAGSWRMGRGRGGSPRRRRGYKTIPPQSKGNPVLSSGVLPLAQMTKLKRLMMRVNLFLPLIISFSTQPLRIQIQN